MARRAEPRGRRAPGRSRANRYVLLLCFLISFELGVGGGTLARRAVQEGDTSAVTSAPPPAAARGSAPASRSGRPPEHIVREVEARFQAGYAHLRAGRHDAALREFVQAAALDPTDPRPHHGSGKAYEAMLMTDRAEESYRTALRADPDFLESKKELAKALHDRGSYREAIELLEPLRARYPDDNFIGGELAVNLLRAGEVARAVELLEAYVRAAGSDAWGHTNLGLAYETDGQLEKAEAEYRRALRLDSTSSVTYFRLGNLLAATERAAEARKVLETYRQLRELENTEHQLEMLLLGNPDDVPALVRLAEVQFRRGRKTEALATLERARALAPSDRALTDLYEKVRADVDGR